jgi:hypothetical protein
MATKRHHEIERRLELRDRDPVVSLVAVEGSAGLADAMELENALLHGGGSHACCWINEYQGGLKMGLRDDEGVELSFAKRGQTLHV